MDYFDTVSFARFFHGSFRLGTGLLDDVALPECQIAVYHAVPGSKEHYFFQKYGHERINFTKMK